MLTAAADARLRRHQTSNFVAAVLAISVNACISTAQAGSTQSRNSSQPSLRSTATAGTPTLGLIEVQLGTVSSSLHVYDGVVARSHTREPLNNKELRWGDSPESYLRRELERTLCTMQWVPKTAGSTAPTLDVDLATVDNVPLNPGLALRLQVKARFHQGSRLLFEKTLTIERIVMGQPPLPEDMILALVDALNAAAQQITANARQVMIL